LPMFLFYYGQFEGECFAISPSRLASWQSPGCRELRSYSFMASGRFMPK